METRVEVEPSRGVRRALIVGMVALAVGSAIAMWWSTTLWGLPDIGDPFDVEAFANRTVPDDENAFVLYREAVRRLGREPAELDLDWSTAGPLEKGWLERSRGALELWRRGTERPGSLYIPPRSMTIMTRLPVAQELRSFARLAQFEGGRLVALGDLEGAWGWYRAIFRSSRHLCQHSTMIERMIGMAMHAVACRKMMRWATDPRVTPPMLRQALSRAISDYAATGPVSDNLKVEYLVYLKTYDDPDLVRDSLNGSESGGPGKPPWFARESHLFGLTKSLKNEPERSRRVARLLYANQLAACDRPRDRRPPVAATLPNLHSFGPTTLVDLYATDASMPTQARALPPDQLARWYGTTLYAARLTLPFLNMFQAIDRERVTQASLVIALADRLCELERGKPPETVEELVGPYLDALPEGYRPIR